MKKHLTTKNGILFGIVVAAFIAFGFLLAAINTPKPAPVPAAIPSSTVSLGSVSSASGIFAPEINVGIWVMGCSSWASNCSAATPVYRSLEDLKDNPRAYAVARDAAALATCGRVPSLNLATYVVSIPVGDCDE